MLLVTDSPTLCAVHQRAADKLSGRFTLTQVVTQLAQNRISRKDAIAIAYNSQLLLNSISVMRHEASPPAHPKPIALPRRGEVTGNVRGPERPTNTYGLPRLSSPNDAGHEPSRSSRRRRTERQPTRTRIVTPASAHTPLPPLLPLLPLPLLLLQLD